ncbi:unnamed protein product, partial [Prorocentrum cordatum]
DLSCAGAVSENLFYFEGRRCRRLYEDLELHALMLTLTLALLVTPRFGLLDPRYCDQYPLERHKRNIPFLLSSHLNHSANRAVLPWLFRQVEDIGHIGGGRLVKMLCDTTMHRWMYTGWTRIGGGAFGTVYKCSVHLGGFGNVAVKQIPRQSNVVDRCVFHDVFSEIACLDKIRSEKHVCRMLDYGVDETGYWIVMQHYSTTLKKWRESLSGEFGGNLDLLLMVYKNILVALQTLHRYGIIHYDLKCDNVMVDLTGSRNDSGDRSSVESGVPGIAITDFGESRIVSSGNELDLKNRGTEVVKCPEMLEIQCSARRRAASSTDGSRSGPTSPRTSGPS